MKTPPILKILNFLSMIFLGYQLIRAPVEGIPAIWIVAFAFGFLVAVHNLVNEP